MITRQKLKRVYSVFSRIHLIFRKPDDDEGLILHGEAGSVHGHKAGVVPSHYPNHRLINDL